MLNYPEKINDKAPFLFCGSKQLHLFVEITPPRLSSAMYQQDFSQIIHRLKQQGVTHFTIPDNPLGRPHQPNLEFYRSHFLDNHQVVLHIAVRNHPLLTLEEKLLKFHSLGGRQLLILHGDTPLYKESIPGEDVVKVIEWIKTRLNQGVSFSGKPLKEATAFVVGCVTNLTAPNGEGKEREPQFQLRRLHEKLRAGADFVITQPPFDLAIAHQFLKTYESLYGQLDIPFICGIFPFEHKQQLYAATQIPGMNIPFDLYNYLSQAVDENTFKSRSLKWTLRLYEEMKTIKWIKGIHFIAPSGNFNNLNFRLFS